MAISWTNYLRYNKTWGERFFLLFWEEAQGENSKCKYFSYFKIYCFALLLLSGGRVVTSQLYCESAIVRWSKEKKWDDQREANCSVLREFTVTYLQYIKSLLFSRWCSRAEEDEKGRENSIQCPRHRITSSHCCQITMIAKFHPESETRRETHKTFLVSRKKDGNRCAKDLNLPSGERIYAFFEKPQENNNVIALLIQRWKEKLKQQQRRVNILIWENNAETMRNGMR